MSGGDKKKRSGGGGGTRTGFGWEEAGAEFYQECYPGAEIDLEALPRDPHYFATLLPSKQNRGATTKKQRSESKSTFKRRTSTRSRRYSTMGQNTVQTDIHVSMMPDLSENLANEESTWEEIMLIKAMPVSMSQKKEMKAKLLSAETFRLQGMKQFKWQRRKLWEYLKMRRKEACESLRPWRHCIRTVEGNMGSGVAAYFLFVKWLLFLNLVTSAVLVSLVIAPAAGSNGTICNNNSSCCQETQENTSLLGVELLEGGGWLETTTFYYGGARSNLDYNLPVGYLIAVVSCFSLSVVAALHKTSRGLRQKLVDSQGQYYKYCDAVFAGWDFGLYNDKTAAVRQRALYYVMRSSLDAERRADERRNQSREESCRLASVRVLVNLFVVLILAASSSLVYFVFVFCSTEIEITDDVWYSLVLEFGPALCIGCLVRFLPRVFGYIVPFERYSRTTSERTTLTRNVVLRIALFWVLLWCIYSRVDDCCWETYMGRQVYKVIVCDVTLEVCLAFLLDFPHMLLSRHVRALSPKNFDLPGHSLDLAYVQALVSFGTFYAPFLPLLAVPLFFILFYMKKFTCLVNCGPPTRLYGSSETEALASTLLSLCLFSALIPWVYAFSQMVPSSECGPLRGLDSAWALVRNTYLTLPLWLRSCLDQLTTAPCVVPLFFVLLIALYYFYIIYRANSQMVAVLKKQLILEGHDKQFLLNRLSAFIKQHQERHKASRSVEHQTVNG